MPVMRLQDEGFAVTAWFMNPNIHPLSEYLRRREAAGRCAERLGIPLRYADETWNITHWLRDMAGRDTAPMRCAHCCHSRMAATFAAAHELGFAFYSSSLLYSRYQPHDVIALGGQTATSGQMVSGQVTGHGEAVSKIASAAANSADGAVTDITRATPPTAATAHDVPHFIYRDFRTDWQAGIDLSKAWDVYRQPYCGCIYSEADRYAKKLRSLLPQHPAG